MPGPSTGRPRALPFAEASNPLDEQAAQWFYVRAALCLPASVAQELAALVVWLMIPRHTITSWMAVTVAWVLGQVGPVGRHGGSGPRGFVCQEGRPLCSVGPSAGRRPRRVVDEVGPVGRSARSARPYPLGFVCAMGSVCSVSRPSRSFCFPRFFRGVVSPLGLVGPRPLLRFPGQVGPSQSGCRVGPVPPQSVCTGGAAGDAPDPMSPMCSMRVACRSGGADP